MLIDLLMDALRIIVTDVAALLPDSTFDPVAKYADAFDVLGQVDYFFPVHELAQIVIGFLQIGIPFMAVQLGLYLYGFIRGGGASV